MAATILSDAFYADAQRSDLSRCLGTPIHELVGVVGDLPDFVTKAAPTPLQWINDLGQVPYGFEATA
ncbi:hypothetical protein NKJ86_13795 [Mesorhizobium sp. M0025]|uniref:hypothetical protein n=1 Tax=Mesorhizobium sp. M0025 TaxID=2956846 RepID=UPI00333D0CF3